MPRQIGPGSGNSNNEETTKRVEPIAASESSMEETRRIEPIGSRLAGTAHASGLPTVGELTDSGATLETEETSTTSKKGLKTGVLITLIVLAAIACVMAYFWITSERAIAAYDDQTQILDDGTYFDGVSILGQDVSGMTIDEARPIINDKVQSDMNAMSVVFNIQEEPHELNAQQLGAYIDVETLLKDALEYGRTGSFAERQKQVLAARNRGTDFISTYSYNQDNVTAAVEEVLAPLADSAQDARVVLETSSDEDSKTTNYSLAFEDEQAGIGVNKEKLVSDIMAAATSGAKSPIEAEITTVAPKVTREDLENLYGVRGIYKTEYGSSAEGRRYNIWKMASIINGVEIQPGDTWSINDEAGPRTYELGWKGAPGISDGAYQEEAGGGICQVSSTLYNAVLRAEVTVAERTHHSWPLSYVPGGLDATISTGAPDFKITNNLDMPIYIATKCDGEGDRTVQVAIIAPKFEDGLTREFSSELIKTTPAGSAERISDSSLPSGTTQTIIGAHEGKTYNVYKKYYDADGNQVGDTELYMVDTYAPKPAKIRVGTGSSYSSSYSSSYEEEPEEQSSEPEAQSDSWDNGGSDSEYYGGDYGEYYEDYSYSDGYGY